MPLHSPPDPSKFEPNSTSGINICQQSLNAVVLALLAYGAKAVQLTMHETGHTSTMNDLIYKVGHYNIQEACQPKKILCKLLNRVDKKEYLTSV